jgi:hypothetical protein
MIRVSGLVVNRRDEPISSTAKREHRGGIQIISAEPNILLSAV